MSALDGVHGTVCNQQQWNQSQQSLDNPSISCLTHGQTIGLALTAEASLLSCVCIIGIFIWIGWNVRRYRKTFPEGGWKLFQGPYDIYMFSLFAFAFVQGMGGVLDVWWAHKGIVTTGHYCTAQDVIKQIGELGVPLITLLLAVHTFVAALWRVGLQARGVALGLVCLACLYIVLWVGIGESVHKNYDTPTPYWCSIGSQFPRERLAGKYIWLWLALFASAILYIPLYFWTEGRLSVDEDCWYRFQMTNADQRVEYKQRRAALGMLLYPIAYSIVVLPHSVTRWLQFSNHHVSSAPLFFGVILFNLSGAINVVLFLIVRPRLFLFPRPEELGGPEIELVPRSGISTDPAMSSSESTTTALADEGSKHGAALWNISSRISDDV